MYESASTNLGRRVPPRAVALGRLAALVAAPSGDQYKTLVAAARSAAVRISPPLAGREDILKRLAPSPFRGCGVRPPALATRPARRVGERVEICYLPILVYSSLLCPDGYLVLVTRTSVSSIYA